MHLDLTVRSLALMAVLTVAVLAIHLTMDKKISPWIAVAFMVSGISGALMTINRWHDSLPMTWWGSPLILVANTIAMFALWKLRK